MTAGFPAGPDYQIHVVRDDRTGDIRTLRCPGKRCHRLVYVVYGRLTVHTDYYLIDTCALSGAEVLDRAHPGPSAGTGWLAQGAPYPGPALSHTPEGRS